LKIFVSNNNLNVIYIARSEIKLSIVMPLLPSGKVRYLVRILPFIQSFVLEFANVVADVSAS
jgi:hypothetical protein